MIPPPDYHVHTLRSCDCGADMAAACETAIARSVREIAFTDHADFGPDDPPDYFRPGEFLADIDRCRTRYGDRLTVLDIVHRILSLMDSDLKPDIRNEASNEIREQYLNAEKSHRLLGWTPIYGLEDGLQRTIAWYKESLAEASQAG